LSNTEETQEIAASKAGMDVKTARKYLRARRLPGEMKAERHWRTRQDGFAEVWPEIREQLRTIPCLEAKTIFAALNGSIQSALPTGSCGPCSVGSSSGGLAKARRKKCISCRSIGLASYASPTSPT
jgi:hypothetical protein